MECPHCHSQVRAHVKLCTCCGGSIPSGQHLLDECGLTDQASLNAPTKPTSPGGPCDRFRFARLGDRFVAFILDLALLFGAFAIVDAWVFMRWGTVEGGELRLTAASLLIASTLNTAILFLYGWLLEAACGAALGKALVGIRVVQTKKCSSISACALRNVLRIVDGLGFYLVGTAVAACSDVRQRIGDICARTAVIEQSFGITIRLTAIALWIATLAGAGWAVPRICSANESVHPRYLSRVVVRIGRTQDSSYIIIAGLTFDVHPSTTPSSKP